MTLEIEQLEIRDFLSQCPPLRRLTENEHNMLTEAIEITYARRGSFVLTTDKPNHYFYLIRSGAVEVLTTEDKLHGHFTEGEWFGYRSAMNAGKVKMPVKAMEDSLLYLLPAELMFALMAKTERVAHFFQEKKAARVRSAITQMRDNTNTNFHVLPVTDLMRRAIQLAPDIPIQDAVQTMSQLNTSLILIMEEGKLAGVVTDQDLRDRVVATGRNLQEPIANIMTRNPVTLSSKAQVTKALLTMAKHNIDELPIVENDQVVGVLTTRDIVKAQGQNAVFLVSEIHRARKLDKLQSFSEQIPKLLVTLVKQHLSAKDIGQAISTVSEAINTRLLQMAEEKFGEPPVPYAWAIAGSMARYEQTAHSDQDNALILSDDYDPEQHGEYFRQLTQFVSDGLNACGYVYCPGNVMATNPQWQQPLAKWMEYFKNWVETPEPKALMYSSIFFDMRVIYGDASLMQPIKDYIHEQAPKNSIFLSYMAANALQYRPPLGFFRSFVLDKHGDQEEALDMKKRGVTPIIDLSRIYALASSVEYLNTSVRLEASAAAGSLSKQGMADLLDAYELINTLRLQHQANNIEKGIEPDNFVPPEEMSSLERRHLKDAFSVVNTIQESLAHAYQTGRL